MPARAVGVGLGLVGLVGLVGLKSYMPQTVPGRRLVLLKRLAIPAYAGQLYAG